MIKKVVNTVVEQVSVDTIKQWILHGLSGNLGMKIVIGVKWDEPYILKCLPDPCDQRLAFFSLDDSKMNMNGSDVAEEFVQDNLIYCDELYVLDDLSDLVELLKRFV